MNDGRVEERKRVTHPMLFATPEAAKAAECSRDWPPVLFGEDEGWAYHRLDVEAVRRGRVTRYRAVAVFSRLVEPGEAA